MPILFTETLIPLPREEVFPFFADPANLRALTPPQLHLRILEPGKVSMEEGARINYRIRLLGIPQRWQSRIAVWEPPERFADEQTKGPYRSWWHTHTFEETAEGQTRMSDHVAYELPFPPWGRVGGPFVRWQLRGIFRYRTRRLGEVLPLGERAGVVAGPVEFQTA